MKQNLESYRLCFDHSPIAFGILRAEFDAEGTVQDLYLEYANGAFAKLVGIPVESIAGESLYVLLPGSDPEWREKSGRILSGNGEMRQDFFQRRLNRFLSIQAYRIAENLCAAVLSDVTSSKQQLLQYEDQLYLYRATEEVGVFRVLLDEGFTLLYGNDHFFHIHGCTEASTREGPPCRMKDLIDSADLPMIQSELKKALDNGTMRARWSARCHTEDGQIRNIRTSAVLKPCGPQQYLVEGVDLDISEQVQTQKQLVEEKLNYHSLLDIVPSGIAVYDAFQDKISHILFFNDEICRIMDSDRAHLNALGSREICCPVEADRKQLQGIIHTALKSGKPVSTDYKIRSLAGREKALKLKLVILKKPDGNLRCYAAFTNVTNLSERERLLLEKERQLMQEKGKTDLVLKRTGTYFWEYDLEHGICKFSQNAAEDFQFPLELSGFPESFLQIAPVDPEFYDDLKRMNTEILSGQIGAPICIKLKKVNGTEVWEELRYEDVEYQAGQPVRAFGCAVNVTEYQQNLQKMREELAYQEGVQSEGLIAKARINVSKEQVETYTDGEQQTQHRAVSYGRGIARLTGSIRWEEMRHQMELELSPRRMLENFQKGRTQYTLEFRIQAPNQPAEWIRDVVKLYEHSITHDLMCFQCFYDITAERELQLVIGHILELDCEALISFSLADGRMTCYGDSTQQKSRIPGFSALSYESACDKMIEILFAPQQREKNRRKFSQQQIVRHLKNAPFYEFVCRCNPQNDRPCYKRWRFLYLDDQKSKILFSRTDVTDIILEQIQQRDRLEVALQRAQTASRAKSDFLARMSHDMRTPMNVILGMTELSKGMELPDDGRSAMSKITAAGEYLLSLINDALEMSWSVQNKLTLNCQPDQIETVLDETLELVNIYARDRKISVQVQKETIAPCRLKFDRLHLQQILLNIVSNAVKFSHVGGTVQLKMEFLGCSDGRAGYRFTVTDHGIGISPDFLSHVFEPFEQEQRLPLAVNEGTGLGLSIAKNLTDLMGGTIQIASKKGVGTTVTVQLSFELSSPAEDSAANSSAGILDGKTILVVEDHPINMEICVRLLKKEGCHVECARNGAESVQIFGASPVCHFSAVLMDLRMPVLDGLDAARAIRSLDRPDASTTPIIAMTANSFQEDRERSRAAGMNAHLNKPLNPAELYDTLARLILD